MIYGALALQSKTVQAIFLCRLLLDWHRYLVLINQFVLSVAFLVEHVYVLPFNSKPGLLLYSTNHYSWSDTFKFGITMQTLAWLLSIIMAMTYFKWLDITPNGLF